MPRGDTRGTHEQGTGSGSCSWNHSKLISPRPKGNQGSRRLTVDFCVSAEHRRGIALILTLRVTHGKDHGNGRNKRVYKTVCCARTKQKAPTSSRSTALFGLMQHKPSPRVVK